MNELNQEDRKELNILLKEAQKHSCSGIYNWPESDNGYIAWRTRANALIVKALPHDSPDLKKIANPRRVLPFDEYAPMLESIKQYSIDHQKDCHKEGGVA